MTPEQYFLFSFITFAVSLFFLGVLGPPKDFCSTLGDTYAAVLFLLIVGALAWPLFISFIVGMGIRKVWKWAGTLD